jgi:hypothetical protein
MAPQHPLKLLARRQLQSDASVPGVTEGAQQVAVLTGRGVVQWRLIEKKKQREDRMGKIQTRKIFIVLV